jgi:hypothetical protein
MALDTLDKVVAGLAAGTLLRLYKASIANQAAGYVTALWKAAGEPAAGATPGGAATPTDDLLGSWPLGDSGALDYYVLQAALGGVTIGTWMLYDRLAHMGGLSGVTTGDQAVGVDLATASGAGRCAANGSDVEWFAEIYTDIGTAAQNCTVTYTDQTDTSRTVVISIGGASPLNRASRCIQIIPNSGESIKSVTKINFATTTGTAGSWGITARKKLCYLPQLVANIANSGDFASIGAPKIADTACLEILVICSTTSTGIVQGYLKVGPA